MKTMKFEGGLEKKVGNDLIKLQISTSFLMILQFESLTRISRIKEFCHRFTFFLFIKIDMSKVKLDVLKPWITKRINELLKMEDDVVVEFVFNQLEEKVECTRGR